MDQTTQYVISRKKKLNFRMKYSRRFSTLYLLLPWFMKILRAHGFISRATGAFTTTSTRGNRSEKDLLLVRLLHPIRSRSCAGSGVIPLSLSSQHYSEGGEMYKTSSSGSSINANDTNNSRREKKNKYSKFSKTTSSKNSTVNLSDTATASGRDNKDPWDLLVEESKRKNQRLQMEKARKLNRVKAQDSMDDDENLVLEDSSSTATSHRQKRSSHKRKRKRNAMIFPNTTNINPYDPTTFGYIELGTIVGPHGVRGEVKLSSTTDFSVTRLCATQPTIKHLKLPTRRSPREIVLLQGRSQLKDSMYILKFEGIGTRDDATKLKGSTLYAREEEEKPPMEEDEYMVSDLIGLNVFLQDDEDGNNGASIGKVNGVVLQEDVTSTGSPVSLGYDFLEISLLSSSSEEEQQLVMIPFVPQIVPHVDIKENRCIYINPPKGLLDLTFVRREKVIIKGFLPPAKDANPH
jgi:16S rRNA processing protein RimM